MGFKHIISPEILQTREGQNLAALQAVAIPAHWHRFIAEGQETDFKRQAVWQGARVLSALKSSGHSVYGNRIIQGTHVESSLHWRIVLLGTLTTAWRFSAF